MEIDLKTITPIHIGNGKSLFALDYVVNDNTYYRISQPVFYDFLEQQNISVEEYVEWIDEAGDFSKSRNQNRNKSEKNGHKGKEDYNQRLSRKMNEFNLLTFAESQKKEAAFIQFLDQHDQVLKAPFKGSLAKGEVREQIKDGNNIPYIPGSSIKGAIRTALLYYFLENHGDVKRIFYVLNTQLDDIANENRPWKLRRFKKQFADVLEQDAFYCKSKNKWNKTVTNDEKFDLMKLVRVSDVYSEEKTSSLAISKVNLHIVQKERSRNSYNADFKADIQGQTPFLEMIPEGTLLKGNLSFNIDFLMNFSSANTTRSFNSVLEKGVWEDIHTKVKKLFNLDINTLTPSNKEDKQLEVEEHLVGCLRKFALAQIQADKRWLQHYKSKDNGRFSKGLDNGYSHLFQSQPQHLMRVGYATGYNGVTELLFFTKHLELKELFGRIMEKFNIGDRPGQEKIRQNKNKQNRGKVLKYKANVDRFPKSRRLVQLQREYVPLGWMACTNLNPVQDKIEEDYVSETLPEPEPPKPSISYFNKPVNPKHRPLMDATVTHSAANDNKVKIHVRPDYEPELKLDVCRSALAVGNIVQVEVQAGKKGKIIQASFKGKKR